MIPGGIGSSLATTVAGDPTAARVVEAIVRGKSPGDLSGADCEDHLVVTPDFVAVLDGMSSPLRAPTEDPTGVLFARAVGRGIAALPADAGPRDAVALLSNAASTVRASHRGPSGAVVAIVSISRREVWRIGDVHVRIGDRHRPGTKLVDEIGAAFRALVNLAELAAGATTDDIRRRDPGRRALRPLLQGQERFANTTGEFGYGVLDGTSVPVEHIEVFALPAGAVDVVLATDGFLSAAPSLEQAEAELGAAIAEDPACLGPRLRAMGKAAEPGATHPDDRTYLRLRLAALS